MKARHVLTAAATLAVLVSSSANAMDKCSVKVDRKTGVLSVSAAGVSGALRWGSTAVDVSGTFFNAATCLSGTTAKKCQIADPATLAAKTPPAACTLYLDDDGPACSAWIPGCSPGVRDLDQGGDEPVWLQWKDAAGATIGIDYPQDPSGNPEYPHSAVLAVASTLYWIGIEQSGFLRTYHSIGWRTGDCSGPIGLEYGPTSGGITELTWPDAADGLAYYPQGSSVDAPRLAWTYNTSGITDQASCDALFGAGASTWVDPWGCCVPSPEAYPVSWWTSGTIDLSGFTTPFHIETH